jgi:hypothetical protein
MMASATNMNIHVQHEHPTAKNAAIAAMAFF